jgi:hypothetical protein
MSEVERRRRRSSRALILGLTGPIELARDVVSKYVTKASTPQELESWATRYKNRITDYAKDANRQDRVQKLLAAWYETFITDIYPRLKLLYAEGKTKYAERVKQIVRGVPTPPPAPTPTPPPAPTPTTTPAPTQPPV